MSVRENYASSTTFPPFCRLPTNRPTDSSHYQCRAVNYNGTDKKRILQVKNLVTMVTYHSLGMSVEMSHDLVISEWKLVRNYINLVVNDHHGSWNFTIHALGWHLSHFIYKCRLTEIQKVKCISVLFLMCITFHFQVGSMCILCYFPVLCLHVVGHHGALVRALDSWSQGCGF